MAVVDNFEASPPRWRPFPALPPTSASRKVGEGDWQGSISMSSALRGASSTADQRTCVRRSGMVDVVETETALDAQTSVVRQGLPCPSPRRCGHVLDLIGQLAADTAIGADAVDLPFAGLPTCRRRFRRSWIARHQRAGRDRTARTRHRQRRWTRPWDRRSRRRSSRAWPR